MDASAVLENAGVRGHGRAMRCSVMPMPIRKRQMCAWMMRSHRGRHFVGGSVSAIAQADVDVWEELEDEDARRGREEAKKKKGTSADDSDRESCLWPSWSARLRVPVRAAS